MDKTAYKMCIYISLELIFYPGQNVFDNDWMPTHNFTFERPQWYVMFYCRIFSNFLGYIYFLQSVLLPILSTRLIKKKFKICPEVAKWQKEGQHPVLFNGKFKKNKNSFWLCYIRFRFEVKNLNLHG